MKRLLDVLRDECGLTGTKEGCGEGECGACTVLMDGITVNSCLVPVVQADGARIASVEGLARRRSLSALQDAFVTMGGAQCGICTPGMLLSAQKLIDESAGVPDEATIREALAGNLCRCTGYQKIIDAVQAAAREERSARRRASAAKSSQSSRRHK
jgi:carbon-monoxide dehydrogenase small subunit